jgi:hypothetical protein
VNHRDAERRSSRKLAKATGKYEAPGLFTEGFYRYSVLSSSPDATNHHPNLLLPAQRFIFCLGDQHERKSELRGEACGTGEGAPRVAFCKKSGAVGYLRRRLPAIETFGILERQGGGYRGV